ncbi:MAG: hypothetical protein K9M07_02055 [Simkaniaceae bacterium]|nr:hypothetical protein [Simkaniaceae bacterium]MCF7852005.1 hypothetical protein [Simkaniaceae bacterium]
MTAVLPFDSPTLRSRTLLGACAGVLLYGYERYLKTPQSWMQIPHTPFRVIAVAAPVFFGMQYIFSAAKHPLTSFFWENRLVHEITQCLPAYFVTHSLVSLFFQYRLLENPYLHFPLYIVSVASTIVSLAHTVFHWLHLISFNDFTRTEPKELPSTGSMTLTYHLKARDIDTLFTVRLSPSADDTWEVRLGKEAPPLLKEKAPLEMLFKRIRLDLIAEKKAKTPKLLKSHA